MGSINGIEARETVVKALIGEFPEIVDASRQESVGCSRSSNPNQCRETRRIAKAHLDLVEKTVVASLIKADENRDTSFTENEVAAATEFALKSYQELRSLCALPQKPADEGKFYKCLMRFYDQNVR